MAKKALLYSAGLIALYLIVRNSKGFATSAGATASGSANLVKAFQGR